MDELELDLGFMGMYRHSLDEKGRVIIPAEFRNKMGERCVLTRGMEGCLFLFSIKDWASFLDKLRNSDFTQRQKRDFERAIFPYSTFRQLDGQGRILIPSLLRERAQLNGEVLLIGVNDRIELWDPQIWDIFNEEAMPSLEKAAEDIFQSDAKDLKYSFFNSVS